MTYREAENVYVISYSVIYRHVNNSNIKKQRGQTALTTSEESMFVSSILVCTEWDYPMDRYDVRSLVKGFLDRRGNRVEDNLKIIICPVKNGQMDF